MKSINKILLNLDVKEESQRALDTAIEFSKLSNATIIAVNIVDKNVVAQLARFSDDSLAEIEIELEENGWRYLYAAEEQAKNLGVHIIVLQEPGYPEEVLPRLASEYHADMLILSHNKLSRCDIKQNRTTEQILEHAPCAVLIIK